MPTLGCGVSLMLYTGSSPFVMAWFPIAVDTKLSRRSRGKVGANLPPQRPSILNCWAVHVPACASAVQCKYQYPMWPLRDVGVAAIVCVHVAVMATQDTEGKAWDQRMGLLTLIRTGSIHNMSSREPYLIISVYLSLPIYLWVRGQCAWDTFPNP